MTRWIKIVVAAFILSMVSANSVRAQDQVVDVNLYLTVTSQITLAFDNLELQLVAGPGFGDLQFLDPSQQPTSFLYEDNYVFGKQSFDGNGPPFPYWATTPPPPYPNGVYSEINGGDVASPASYVTLAPGTYLVAEVEYDIPANGPSTPIQVLPVNDPGQTYFQDQNGSSYSYSYSFDTDNNTGTFLISPAAVPEPSSLTLLAISSGLGGLLWYRKSRNRRAASVSQ